MVEARQAEGAPYYIHVPMHGIRGSRVDLLLVRAGHLRNPLDGAFGAYLYLSVSDSVLWCSNPLPNIQVTNLAIGLVLPLIIGMTRQPRRPTITYPTGARSNMPESWCVGMLILVGVETLVRALQTENRQSTVSSLKHSREYSAAEQQTDMILVCGSIGLSEIDFFPPTMCAF